MRIKVSLAALVALGLFPCTWGFAILDEPVASQGLIVPRGGLIKVAAPAGPTGQPIVRDLKVTVGDVVRPGQPIATLASRPLAEAELAAAQADGAVAEKAVAIAEARLASAQARLVAGRDDIALAENQLAAAEKGLDQPRAELAKVGASVGQAEAGKREALEKLDAALAKVTGVRAAYQKQLEDFDPGRRETEENKFQQRLLNEELRELSATRAATVNRLEAEVAAAQAGIYSAQAAIAAAEAQVDVARTQLDAARGVMDILEANVATARAELSRAQAGAVAAQAGIKRAEANLALTELVAPSGGTVLHIAARPGEAIGPPGVVVIGDLSDLIVEAEIYIDDVRRVKAGQSVVIESDAFAGKLSGSIEYVGQLVNPQGLFSNDPLAYTDQRVVNARIRLDETDINGWTPPVHSQVVVRINK